MEQHLNLAQAQFDKENFKDAAAELEKALAPGPIKGACYQLGYAYWKLRRYAEAQRAFEQELKFEPPDPYSLYYLGRIVAESGNQAEAVRRFEKAAAISPILDVYQRMGSAYLEMGDLARATDSYERAVKLHPERGEGHYQLAQAYTRAGRKADAQRAFETVRTLKVERQQEIRDLMQCEQSLKEKRTEEALALANKLARTQDADLLVSLGSLLGRYGRHEQAIEYLERAVQLAPSFEAHFNLAVTRVALKNPARAVESLSEAVQLKPDSYEARSLLGTLLAQQGKDEESIPHLRRAVELRPDNPRLLALLGLKYTQGRYYKDAIEILRKAIALEAGNPELRFLLIQAHYMNQDSERALSEARGATRDFPDLAKSHMVLALQLHNMGRFQEARPHLEKAIAADPNLVEAHATFGDVLLRQGQVEQSLPYFRTAIERDPSLVEPYLGLGKALIQLKRYDEAVRDMQQAVRAHPNQAQPHLYLAQAYRGLGKMEEAKRESEVFESLNRQRMEKRDREGERTYVP